jgi:hypothetical protein
VVVVVRSVVVGMNEEKRVVVDWGLFIMGNEKKEREGLMVRVYGMRDML